MATSRLNHAMQVRLPRKGYNPGATRRLVLTLNRPSSNFRHIRLAKCSDARYLALLLGILKIDHKVAQVR